MMCCLLRYTDHTLKRHLFDKRTLNLNDSESHFLSSALLFVWDHSMSVLSVLKRFDFINPVIVLNDL